MPSSSLPLHFEGRRGHWYGVHHVPNTGPNNPGNPTETTTAALAQLAIHLTGSRSRIDYRPLAEDDPRQRMANDGLQLSGQMPDISGPFARVRGCAQAV
jgi:hypothetical protein